MRLTPSVLSLTILMALPCAVADENTSESLAQRLKKAADSAADRLPPELLKTFEHAIDEVRSTGIEKNAKQVGDTAADATLTDWTGQNVRLSDLWKQKPIVLMWYRGGWCPYCNIQLHAMQQKLKEIRGTGADLVVLTPELPEKAKETAKASDADFVTLHDKDNRVARMYGIVFQLPNSIVPIYRDRLKLGEYNGNTKMELPLAATYVINTDGQIHYSFLNADYRKRAEPDDILRAVRKLSDTRVTRPPSVGDQAPNFTLKTLNGRSVSLSSVLTKGPAAVVVLRGYPGYQCPLCTRQVASLLNSADAFAADKATVILVYPGPAHQLDSKAREFIQEMKLPDHFILVTDPDYRFTNSYALRWDAPRETAYPSTFVVDQKGTIQFARVSTSHGGRADTAEIIQAISQHE